MTHQEILSYINQHFLDDKGKLKQNSYRHRKYKDFFKMLSECLNLKTDCAPELMYNFLNPNISKICRCCKKNNVEFLNFYKGYRTQCSIECLRKDPETNSKRTKAIVSTLQELHGEHITNSMQLDKTKEKVNATIQKKYGKKWYVQTKEFKNQYIEISQERYGTDYPLQNTEVKARVQQGIIDKFGRKSPRPFFENRIKRKAEIEQWCQELQITIDGMQYFDKNISMTDQIMTYTHTCGHSWQKDMTKTPLCEMCHRGSAVENSIKEWLMSCSVEFEPHNRQILKPQELDIYFHQHAFAIEVDGLYWHCDEAGKDRKSLLNKTNASKRAGVELMHIWENEWWDDDIQFKLKNLLKIRLGIAEELDVNTLYPKELTETQEQSFFNKYNLFGYEKSDKCFGLVDSEGNIRSALSIKRARHNNTHEYKLLRFCSNAIIKEGLHVLMNNVKRILNKGESIIVEVDRRFSNGQEFLDAGFKFKNYSKPHYRWWNYKTFIEGGATMKKTMKILLGENYSPELTERENMHSILFNRLTDCGNSRFVFTKK